MSESARRAKAPLSSGRSRARGRSSARSPPVLLTTGGVLYMHGYGWTAADHRLHRGAGDHGRVVARRDPRGDLSGLPHSGRAARPALRHGVVHRLRGDVLCRLFLGVLRVEPVPGRRRLAAQGHPPVRSVRIPVSQHADPAAVGNHGHLGASFADRGRPQWIAAGFGADRLSRPLLHLGPGLRIQPRPVSLSPAASTRRPFSWRPAFTASTSSSARLS